MSQRRIAIVGGGLAGFATARALEFFGMRADVFEAAPALGEIGAAVTISPNAAKALQAIGLGEKIAAVATPNAGIESRDMQTGETLNVVDLRAVPERYGAPHASFHRADLHTVLAGSVDPASIHLDHRLTAVEERGATVRLTFANGAVHDADVVIAADGVRSVVRQALYGEDNPEYTGQMVWRSLLRGTDVPPDVLAPHGHVQWVGPGRHFVTYYMRNGGLVNVVTQEDTDTWVAESWSTPGDPDEMRRSFPNAEPRMEKLLNAITECSKWGLFTRPLTENWGRQRIQLIGDAAHAMLPNIGQGAGQAFEDAYILARWLKAESDPVAAFQNFRRVRIPRVHTVQTLALARARLKHLRDGTAQKATLSPANQSMRKTQDWLWGYDPTTEWDKEPSLPEAEAHVS
jgi:salicylate hydroxylase